MINILNIFKQKQTNFNLSPEQFRLVKYLINYGWHRANCHNTPLSFKKRDIDNLRVYMGIINKSKL